MIDNGGDIVFELEFVGQKVSRIEIDGVLSYRFTASENYYGYIEDSFDELVMPKKPAWTLRLADEDSARGEFVRRRTFFHLNIDGVGILECYALGVRSA